MSIAIGHMTLGSGSQTGRCGVLVRRETLPGAPPNHAKVVAFVAVKSTMYLEIL